MYRKYNVVTKKGFDISDIQTKLTSSYGDNNIPSREVEINNPLPASKRVTTFLLTDEESIQIANIDHVQTVCLDDSELPEVKNEHCATQSGDFRKTGFIEADNSNYTNWGLFRHNTRALDTHLTASATDAKIDYSLAGEGVDVVIMDTGIIGDHPDFTDENGNSRIQKINWLDVYLESNPFSQKYTGTYVLAHTPEFYYTDPQGVGPHGTQTASIACGKKYGYAKKANIYLAKADLGSPYFQMDNIDWYNTLIHWHKNKNNNRPTIVNMSFGKNTPGLDYSEIVGGAFTDSAETPRQGWNRVGQSDQVIADTYNIKIGSTHYNFPYQHRRQSHDEAEDALIEEMTDAGIHVVIAAGNFSQRMVKTDHPEYDNYVNYSADFETPLSPNGSGNNATGAWFYNRKGSPHADDAIIVGALQGETEASSGDDKLDKIAHFSGRGSRIDIYAAGQFCVSAAGNYKDGAFSYPDNNSYSSAFFAGTSCAAPMVTGLCALHLSANPDLTPKELKQKLADDATQNAIFEDTSGGYSNTDFFADSINKILYNPYNTDAGLTFNKVTAENANINTDYKFKTTFRSNTDILAGYQGVKTYADGNGQFENYDSDGIYNNSKIIGFFYNEIGSNFILTLKFSGDIRNGGWEKLEWVNFFGDDYEYNRFKRKDATFNHIEKSFTWTVSKANINIIYSDNRIGII
nr:protease [uncultured Mediterranean phage uvMED]